VRSDIWDCCLDTEGTRDSRRLASLEVVREAGEPGEGGAGRDAVSDVTLPCLLIGFPDVGLLPLRESLGVVADAIVPSSWAIWSGGP
jgi:hypothetical protein